MRKLKAFFVIAAMLAFTTILAQPKAKVFVNAGINSTGVSIKSQSPYVTNDVTNGVSWSAGGRLELVYPSNIILYTGLNATSYHYKITSTLNTSQPLTYKGVYTPIYLNIPAGIGYHWQVSDKTAINFYAGVYANIGAGGNMRRSYSGLFTTDYTTKQNIDFGNDENSNLRFFNWGIQPGVSFGFGRFQLALHYDIGMSNMAPDFYQETHKLNSASLSLKYQLNSPGKIHSKRNNPNF